MILDVDAIIAGGEIQAARDFTYRQITGQIIFGVVQVSDLLWRQPTSALRSLPRARETHSIDTDSPARNRSAGGSLHPGFGVVRHGTDQWEAS